MKTYRKCYLSILLGCMTFLVSVYVSYSINGVWFSTVNITKLSFLGIVHDDILRFEFWRLVTSQLIHVKYPHMLFNVLFLIILGSELEKRHGCKLAFLLWIIGGGIGTYVSSLFTVSPWNVGTGASQAVLTFATANIYLSSAVTSLRVKAMATTYIIISLVLDFLFASYPKPGHIVSMFLGFLICVIFTKFRTRSLLFDRYSK